MKHDYEYAFNAHRTEYLTTGKKNPCRYRITGCFNTGDYWCEDCDNKEELAWAMRKIGGNETILQSSLAMQNEIGQLMWTREFGFVDGIAHPKYMDEMSCFDVKNCW